MKPLSGQVEWSTWGSKLDNMFAPVFAVNEAEAETPKNKNKSVRNYSKNNNSNSNSKNLDIESGNSKNNNNKGSSSSSNSKIAHYWTAENADQAPQHRSTYEDRNGKKLSDAEVENLISGKKTFNFRYFYLDGVVHEYFEIPCLCMYVCMSGLS